MNLKNIQEELEKLYCVELEKLEDIENLKETPTHPLLLSIPDEYDKKLKIMLFGQETNDWYGKFNNKLDVNEFMFKYREFWNLKIRPYSNKGPLMQTFNGLQKHIGEDQVSCIWNNIIKIGKNDSAGTPIKETREWQKNWRNVIKEEVKLLEPDILLFFTGPNYDKHIEDVFGSFTEEIYQNQKTRKLAKLNFHDNKDLLAYRTYHPGYLRRSGLSKEYLKYFSDDIAKIIEKKK